MKLFLFAFLFFPLIVQAQQRAVSKKKELMPYDKAKKLFGNVVVGLNTAIDRSVDLPKEGGEFKFTSSRPRSDTEWNEINFLKYGGDVVSHARLVTPKGERKSSIYLQYYKGRSNALSLWYYEEGMVYDFTLSFKEGRFVLKDETFKGKGFEAEPYWLNPDAMIVHPAGER